jgi:hypothetical protein
MQRKVLVAIGASGVVSVALAVVVNVATDTAPRWIAGPPSLDSRLPGPADGACLGSGWRLPQPEQVAERI